jgi:hypothetical protein
MWSAVGLPLASTGNGLREPFDEQRVQDRWRVLVDVLLQQRALGPRVDDRRAKLLQVSNGTLGGGDAFFVGPR